MTPENPEVKAAAERLRLLDAGAEYSSVYPSCCGLDPPQLAKRAAALMADDRRVLADAYLALFDESQLSLDVLTAELGEPIQSRESSADGTLEYLWCVGAPVRDKWIEWSLGACWGKGVGRLETLGALRRLLSVVNDPNPDRSEER